MGESRKRKSLWDMEDEAKFSSSGKASALKSRDHSGRSNWESVDGNVVAPAVDRFYKDGQDDAEARELRRGKTYDKNLSRGFDGAEWHKRDHTPEYDWGGSGRYPGRGRSWSRSRSKSRSRSRSRGGRRGRSRSPDKARDRGKDRRRSRSRSRSNGSARGQMGNRSPIGDYRQSGGWSEGNRHEKSSRSCREFFTGRCNKGSQCRFLHPDNTGSSHRNHVEDERAENWRNRPQLGRISGYSNDRGPGPRSRDDAYNSYYEEDDYSRSQSRNAVPCRDFVKGSCRWGDTCRFSHHEASGDSYGKGTRNASYGRDIEQQANRNVKPLCKFFAAGNCFRDNCRFSHDSPELQNVEGRPGEDTSSFSLDNKGKWWNGPSWNDSVDVSDKVKSTGWSEDVANTNIVGVTTIGGTDDRLDHRRESEGRTRGIQKQNDDYMKRDQQLSFPEDEGSTWGIPKQNDDYLKRDQQLSLSENEGRTWEIPKQNDDYRKIDRRLSLSENESRTWEIPKQNDDYMKRDQQLSLSENEGGAWEIPKQNDDYYRKRDQQFSLSGGSGRYDVEMDITEPMGKDNITDDQEHIFHESRLQNPDAISHVYGQNTMQEGQGLAIKASQNDVFADSHIQQHHQRQAENVSSFGTNAFDEVNGSRNSKYQVLFPGQIFKQNDESLSPGHPMFSNETDRNQHMLIDLNGPEQHKMSPGLQYQMQNLQNKTPEMSDVLPPQFVSDAVDNEQVVQMTKSPVGIASEQGVPVIDSSAVMAQMLVKEEHPPEVYAGLDTSGSIGRLPSYSDTTHFNPLVNTMNGQSNPVTNSLDLLDSFRNVKAGTGTNHNPASDTVSHSVEQKNQVHVEQSSMPTINHVFGSSTAQQHDSSKVKEQEIVSNSEVDAASKTVVEEGKCGQENKHSENVDGHGKVDDNSVVKDDKGLRLFKNALVEFVKEILKPTWKEGRMSREVHKAIVRKVVDKVTCTIPNEHVPKTQNKVDQYLTTSKPKISKLVQAYVERSLKPEP